MKPLGSRFSSPGGVVCRVRISRDELAEKFGPTHGETTEGMLVWGFALDCGLKVEIRFDEKLGLAFLHARFREIDHALRHLGWSDQVEWRADRNRESFEKILDAEYEGQWGRWSVHRHGDGDEWLLVQKCLSVDEANCLVEHLKSSHEDEAYRVEETSVEAFEAIRADEASKSEERTRRRMEARKSRDPEDRWEIWLKHTDGAQSLIDIFAGEANANARLAELESDGDYFIRQRRPSRPVQVLGS